MKNIIRVVVYDYEVDKQSPPSGLAEYIEWLQSKLEEIPEEFRSTARTDIYGSESYGSGVLCYTIKYDRPETEKEREARENVDRLRAEALQRKELAMLEALRQKYESAKPLNEPS